ncbi:MAG: hypothetical protein ACOZQL_18990 [Myxococcota bacterium]
MMTSAILMLALTAAPQDWLATAEKQCFELKYADCLESLERAWVKEGNSRLAVIRILELTGVTAAQLKQASRSQQGLRRLFLIDFDHQFNAKFAPRVNTQILEAKSWAASAKPLAWAAQEPVISNRRVTSLGVKVTNDPLTMAVSARFNLRTPGAAWTTVEVPLADGAATTAVNASEVDWWVELLSASRGVLSELGSASRPMAARVPAPPPELTPRADVTSSVPAAPVGVTLVESGPRFRPAAWVLTVAGVLSVGAGVLFGVMSAQARSALINPTRDANGVIQNQTQVQATALNAQLQRDALLSTGLFIGGGVALAGGVTLFVVGSLPQQGGATPTAMVSMRTTF